MKASKKGIPDVCYCKGYYFNWLQALSRKMQDMGLSQDYASKSVKKMGLLTVIPREDIESIGIPHLLQTYQDWV
jgi:hypothetical protein